MAAQGQIVGPQIEHHGPLQEFGQERPLEQLPTAPPLATLGRTVPEGLAVATHHGCLASRIAEASAARLHLGDRFGQVQECLRRDRLTLADRDQLALQLLRVGQGAAGEQAPARPARGTLEPGQHGIDPIGAGAAHQPQNRAAPHWWGRPSSDCTEPITTSRSPSLRTWEAGGFTDRLLTGPAARMLTS